ncbi:tyrosine-type recombinase/integrase [Paremcibacter congregatus]|uniref:Integrase n=1 Tax=Paremcibacter congregatus TaxID=2043170 RepID=A0A2G4YPP9_9PROT|nr:site-specific integrase [Paremcibacter congregatus]PHZ84313.1 integrase [Paremcibacter congregatus]QDE28532.1 site-specific integrase [Paremcibacter congregatus]
MVKHSILGGKVHVYKRENSNHWQCSTYIGGKNRRVSTKEDSLSRAKDFAEDWYLELRGKNRLGELRNEKTFKFAAKQFEREYEIITEGQRNKEYVAGHKSRIRMQLNPFFGNKGLSEITPGLVQEYRITRMQLEKPPARSTLHHEIVTLRQVLKTATRHGWLQHLPDLSPPYRASTKVSHRAWFNPEEYKRLYEATRRRAQKPLRNRYKYHGEQLHDMVLFMANTGIRPDEALRLEYRDVEIVEDLDTNETILVISVRGKRGVGFCKSTNGAVRPFERLLERNKPSPDHRIFPTLHRELLNRVLEDENLKLDREGNRRTAYSLRHSYICFRLMEGADIYQIAKNCRTSVEMIEKYYASHIKNSINAAAINVRRPKREKKTAL